MRLRPRRPLARPRTTSPLTHHETDRWEGHRRRRYEPHLPLLVPTVGTAFLRFETPLQGVGPATLRPRTLFSLHPGWYPVSGRGEGVGPPRQGGGWGRGTEVGAVDLGTTGADSVTPPGVTPVVPPSPAPPADAIRVTPRHTSGGSRTGPPCRSGPRLSPGHKVEGPFVPRDTDTSLSVPESPCVVLGRSDGLAGAPRQPVSPDPPGRAPRQGP